MHKLVRPFNLGKMAAIGDQGQLALGDGKHSILLSPDHETWHLQTVQLVKHHDPLSLGVIAHSIIDSPTPGNAGILAIGEISGPSPTLSTNTTAATRGPFGQRRILVPLPVRQFREMITGIP